ncbi:MAG: hypothetical protein LBE24_05550 [Methylobacillus sp.]|jgi:hypothetical protein|nr:hypothetical protein [Methylobacillus sp.]
MKKYKYIGFLALFLFGGIAHADDAIDCSTSDSMALVISQFEQTFYTIQENEEKLKGEIAKEVKARVDADKWTEEHIKKIFMDIKSWPQFASLQEQEIAYRAEVKAQNVLRESSSNTKELCENTIHLMETMQKLHEINAQEFTMIIEKIREAK